MYIIIYKVINISCLFTNSTNLNKICTNLFNYNPNSLKLTYSYIVNYIMYSKFCILNIYATLSLNTLSKIC